MATFRSIEGIPYHHLRETINSAVTFLNREFKKCYMDKEGRCAITFGGTMPVDEIRAFLININPEVARTADSEVFKTYPVEVFKDFGYSGDDTHIYTPEGLNYREL